MLLLSSEQIALQFHFHHNFSRGLSVRETELRQQWSVEKIAEFCGHVSCMMYVAASLIFFEQSSEDED